MEDRPAFHSRKRWLPLLVTLSLMVGLGSWAGWQWHVLEARSRSEQEQRFSAAVDDIERTLRNRMRTYEMVLRGLAGLMASRQGVSEDEWLKAADQLQLQDSYPGIQAICLARYARGDTLQTLIEGIRQSGRSGFRLFPEGERDEHAVVDYIYPLDWRNRRVPGFDLFSDRVRREAVVAARDSGTAVLTGPLRLKQETELNAQAGVLLIQPLYAEDAPVTTRDERRQAFVGALYGAFRLTDLMEGVLDNHSALFQLQLFDAAEPERALLVGRAPVSKDASFERARNLYLYGRNWRMVVASTPEYEAMLRDNRLTFSLWSALAAALLFALLVGGYLYLRERALAISRTLGAQLQEREARFRQLIERLPIATLVCDERGRIELANGSAATLLGSSTGRLLGERLERFVPGDSNVLTLPGVAGAGEECQVRREDGDLVPVALSLTHFQRDDGLRHILNLVDLQPRKRDEERFRNVVEASPHAIVLMEDGGRMVMANRQTERLFGYGREQLLGQPVAQLVPALSENASEVAAAAAEAGQSQESRQLWGLHRDGHRLPVEVGVSPLRSGEERLWQAVIVDISQRQAAERRLREQADQLAMANRYKTEFLANMSHELRTPLNSILLLSDQLKQNAGGTLDSRQVRHADIIHRAGNELLSLINDVLDLATIEAGRLQLKPEPLDPREVLLALEKELSPLAAQKGLELVTCIEPAVPALVFGDRRWLSQIMRNLLSNAIKFTDQGEVSVLLRCIGTEGRDRDGTLQMIVKDTGIGIAAEQRERIFQAFQQLDGSNSRRHGGTGLGLAITRQLVTVLGGRIELHSAPGEGAIFTVELPLNPTGVGETRLAQPPSEEPQAQQPQRSADRPRPRLLVVGDDSACATLVVETAREHGYLSERGENTEYARVALQGGAYAGLILDLAQPADVAWRACQGLLVEARKQGVPIIVACDEPLPGDWQGPGLHLLAKPLLRAELQRLLIELASQEWLLLASADPARQQLRDGCEQLGYQVRVAPCAEDARRVFAEQGFDALLIDSALSDDDGLNLLDRLQQLRPLAGTTVVLISRGPLTDTNLRRLRSHSAILLSDGMDFESLRAALRPGGIAEPGGPPGASEPPLAGQRVLLVEADIRSLYVVTAMLDELGLQIIPATGGEEALACFAVHACDLVLLDMELAMASAGRGTLIHQLKEDYGCQVPIVALAGEREQALAAGADDHLAKPVDPRLLAERLRHWLSALSGPSGD